MVESVQQAYPWFYPLVFFSLGLMFGSFANVVIYRLPLGKSVVTPRSACPACSHLIRWYENIPILSWLFLRGRCSSCKVRISFRYPMVELLMGLLFLALYLKFGFSWTLLELLVFGFGIVVVTFIDFDHMILPDVFTLSGIVIGLLGAVANPERSFMNALWGVLMGGGFLYATAFIYYALRKQEGMGGGDIKLLAWIGAVLGWKSIPFTILSASIVGSMVGILVAIRSKDGLKSGIPFGPYLVLGAILYIFSGSEITQWYLNLFLPSILSPVN